MANQKITELNSLPTDQIADNDLLVIVDVNDFTSPTGETKKTTAGAFSDYVLRNTHAGAVEEDITQANHGFFVGAVIRRHESGSLFVTASADTAINAEAVGIVRQVSSSNQFTVVYSGLASFPSAPFPFAGLSDGSVYFLGMGGQLTLTDPIIANPTYVSKPMMVALGFTKGLVVNYRGLELPDAQEDEIVKLTIQDTCNGFLVGDAVRRVRPEEGLLDATLQNVEWTLANADAFDNTEVVGVVTERSATYFVLTLTGRIQNLQGLNPGHTYYVTTTQPDGAGNGGFAQDLTGSRATQRNVFPVSPTCPNYSRPVYVAVSETEAVMLNHRTLPSPDVSFNHDCTELYGRYVGTFEFDRPEKPGTLYCGLVLEDLASVLVTYANFISSPSVSVNGDRMQIYWTPAGNPNDPARAKWNMLFAGGTWTYQGVAS